MLERVGMMYASKAFLTSTYQNRNLSSSRLYLLLATSSSRGRGSGGQPSKMVLIHMSISHPSHKAAHMLPHTKSFGNTPFQPRYAFIVHVALWLVHFFKDIFEPSFIVMLTFLLNDHG